MNYLQVKNWEKFQHYKDRTPPWIKLHRDLLNDYNFSCLQDASKLHLMLIWLLASQLDNKIPNDAAWIARRINVSDDIDLNDLIDNGFLKTLTDASKPLAKRTPETEAYKQEEERAEAKPRKPQKRGSRLPADWQPEEKLLAWAMKERTDLDMQKVIDSFTDYWISKTGSAATKLDWDATFRNWVRNEKSNRTTRHGTSETPVQRRTREADEARARIIAG